MSLNVRQEIFANSVAGGKSLTDSYLLAYPRAERESARSASARLAKHPDVSQELSRIRDAAQKESVLSYQQKREFLTAVIQKTPADPPKVADQLRAVELDNKMAGHNYDDRDTSSSNPFQLIVNFTNDYKSPTIEMETTERLH